MDPLSTTLGIVSAVIQASAYGFYWREVWKGRLCPNKAAWFLWGALAILSSSSYCVASGDWVKSLLIIVNSVMCILTVVITWRLGRFEPLTLYAKIALAIGLLTALVWLYFREAAYAQFFMQGAILVGFYENYKMAWVKPEKELAIAWLIWSGAYAINIATVLLRWNPENWVSIIYPVNSLVCHFAMAMIILLRLRHYRARLGISSGFLLSVAPA